MFRKKIIKPNEVIIKLNEIIQRLDEYILIKENKKRFILGNLIAGITRGFGIAIGIIIFSTITIIILRNLVTLPVIGKYIAEIVNIVEVYLSQM